MVVLALLAALILGPDRLPEYAQKLGRLVRGLRRMATGAREQLREEVGPDIDDVDWRKLDPRQYDPRRIIKEALFDDDEPEHSRSADTKPVNDGGPRSAGAGAFASSTTSVVGAATASSRPEPTALISTLKAGEAAPFDSEAT